MPKEILKTAVIQFNATDDKARNLGRACHYVEQAAGQGAKFILLPEVFVYRGRLSQELRETVVEKIPGETTGTFGELARTHKAHILLGSLYERSPDRLRPYNTSVLISPDGAIAAKYRKINLFEARVGGKRVREADQFSAGGKAALASVGPFRVGMSICFDLRFGSLYNKYRCAGAHILVVPSAFTHETGKAHWQTLLRARAIENFCYVLAPNQIGEDHRGIRYYGHSLIISPWGEVLQEASGYKEEIIYGTLEMDQLQLTRSRIVI